ncbi:MAG TPA: hypothetical protein ACFCUY_08485 [Xenococcaceae cyanobacterium]
MSDNSNENEIGQLISEQNLQEKARWLMLNQAKADKNRNDSMLRRSAHEVGLVGR